jgi:hypothetical protein
MTHIAIQEALNGKVVARLDLHEMQDALAAGRLVNDGNVVHSNRKS